MSKGNNIVIYIVYSYCYRIVMFGYWHLFRILLLNICKLSVFCRTASETSMVPQASRIFPVSVHDNKRLPCEVGTRDDLGGSSCFIFGCKE